jgi:hypothetical protein
LLARLSVGEVCEIAEMSPRIGIPTLYSNCMLRSIAWILIFGAYAAFSQTIGVWERRASFPVASTEVAGAAIDRFVYVVCGLTLRGSSNRLHRYDTRNDTWLERASAPIEGGADHCNVAAAGGKLYLLAPFVSARLSLKATPGNMIRRKTVGKT